MAFITKTSPNTDVPIYEDGDISLPMLGLTYGGEDYSGGLLGIISLVDGRIVSDDGESGGVRAGYLEASKMPEITNPLFADGEDVYVYIGTIEIDGQGVLLTEIYAKESTPGSDSSEGIWGMLQMFVATPGTGVLSYTIIVGAKIWEHDGIDSYQDVSHDTTSPDGWTATEYTISNPEVDDGVSDGRAWANTASPNNTEGDPVVVPTPSTSDYIMPTMYMQLDGVLYGTATLRTNMLHTLDTILGSVTGYFIQMSGTEVDASNADVGGGTFAVNPVVDGLNDVTFYFTRIDWGEVVGITDTLIITTASQEDLVGSLNSNVASGYTGVLVGYELLASVVIFETDGDGVTTSTYTMPDRSLWDVTYLDVFGGTLLEEPTVEDGLIVAAGDSPSNAEGTGVIVPVATTSGEIDDYIIPVMTFRLDGEGYIAMLVHDYKTTVGSLDGFLHSVGFFPTFDLTTTIHPSVDITHPIVDGDQDINIYMIKTQAEVGDPIINYAIMSSGTLGDLQITLADYVLGEYMADFEIVAYTKIFESDGVDSYTMVDRSLWEAQYLIEREITTPLVTIIDPQHEDIVSGSAWVLIEAINQAGEIKSVNVNFDGGDWLPCTLDEETGYWKYVWDTKTFVNRDNYVLGARALA